MSIKVMNDVWTHSKMDGTALLLMLALADNADENGRSWPSTQYLADKIRISKRSVIRVIKRCEKAGELSVKRQKGYSNKYQILVSDCHQCQIDTSDTHDTTGGDKLSPTGDTGDTSLVTPVSPKPSITVNNQSVEPSEKRKKPKPKPKVTIPENLDTPQFVKAWDDYVEHRKEIKAKMTPRAETMALNKLADHPPDIAKAMIEQSIMNGWKGLFDLKQGMNGNGRHGRQTKMQKGIDAIDQAFEEMEAQGLV